MRRLAAIISLDVCGFSRLMAVDEDGTLASWTQLRQRIEPMFTSVGGRVVKATGDGLLVEAPSAIEAVKTAIRVQAVVEDWNLGRPPEVQLKLRIGISVGDVIFDDTGDIYGNGVNVAARLEDLAEPGSVYLSEAAYLQVRGRVEAVFDNRGEQWVKNLPSPIKVWAVVAKPLSWPTGGELTIDSTVRRADRQYPARITLDDRNIPIDGPLMTIGRLPDRTMVLDDPEVSRRHAEIRRTQAGFLLVDMGTTNGTLVNGNPVSEHLLESGDTIEIGSTVMRFEQS